ncbi:F64 [Hirschfeldia incana]|nr:F64 [Hirschfeldia incana]
MGMKFLNKKGWHTGSLRNIENVWKAEQKQEAEQKKLEELRLQIVQERERSEFRALQEQAGLIPRQERLEFLYDSGLAVGKGSASGSGVSFQKEEQPLANAAEAGNNASEKPDPSAPGALFEDKTPSANDSWRKLHSDPLLLIRQREQEALARIKNNPVKMALIRKSVEEKGKGKDGDAKERKKKRKHRKSRHHSGSEEDSGEETGRKSRHHRASGDHDKHYERESRDKHSERRRSDLEDESKRRESHDKHSERRRSDLEDGSKRRESHDRHYERRRSELDDESKRRESEDKHYERRRSEVDDESKRRESRREDRPSEKYRSHSPYSSRLERENLKRYDQEDIKRKTEDLDIVKPPSREENGFQNRRRKGGSKLSEEERAARFKQMQMDAEVHEEQRWRRLKKADETDAVEASKNKISTGKSFLDDANKSVYGVEKGGSSTIEESVRRRSYYSQRGTEAEGNAFRR